MQMHKKYLAKFYRNLGKYFYIKTFIEIFIHYLIYLKHINIILILILT